ncbi:scaffolding protein [Proteus sp. G2618]|uniref:scaffolding protein n=1 Tax=Proteus sp. G2618 TaxID=2698841 RepID=UPI001378DC94|nr:scaffolding protein [Proteus sp. G2618]NBN70561.1 scaffolding protein [Proteus sp. G2618]
MLDTAENTPEVDADIPDVEVDTPEAQLNDDPNAQQGNDAQPSDDDNDDDSEQAFYFGDDELTSPVSEEERDTGLVKHLRNTIKEKDKELREARKQQTHQPVTQQQLTPPPRMPQLSDEGIDYDDAVYSQKVQEWAERNARYQSQKAEQERQQQSLQQAHQQKIASYQERVKSLRVSGYQQAEQSVIEEVPEQIQAMIIHFAEKPEMVVLALGRNAELRQQMANATDPVAVGRLIGSIESKAKIMPKPKNKPAATPEVKGGTGAVLNNLDKLKEKARETGDWSQYFAAKKAKK